MNQKFRNVHSKNYRVQKIRLRHPVEITFVLNSKRVCLKPVSFIQQVDLLFVYHDLVINSRGAGLRPAPRSQCAGTRCWQGLVQGMAGRILRCDRVWYKA